MNEFLLDTVAKNMTRPMALAFGISDESVPNDPRTYKFRQELTNRITQEQTRREQALHSDPAEYVRGNPLVSALAAQVNPQDHSTFETYANASLELQSHMGVQNPHVLTKAQAIAMAGNITQADPATTDAGKWISSIKEQTGAYWQNVWQDMVTEGKLPATYQILANIPNDSTRATFQQALHAAQNAKGVDGLERLVTGQAAKDIKNGIGFDGGPPSDSTFASFVRSQSVPGIAPNLELVGGMAQAVRTLAYFNATQGDPSPLASATQALIGDRYAFSNLYPSMRIPKGPNAPTMPDAHQAIADTLATLTPADLRPEADPSGKLTLEQRQQAWLNAAKRGGWMPTPDDKGIQLYAVTDTGRNTLVYRADGSGVIIPYAQMRGANARANPPGEYQPGNALQ